MKATYAGHLVPLTNIRNYLNVCNRSANDLEYYVPVNNLSDVQVFIDLGNFKPAFKQVYLYNLCTDTQQQIAPDRYIIGVDPEGAYYAVFTFTATTPAPPLFALAFYLHPPTVGVTLPYIYFTQAYSTMDCRGLTRIDACFPIRRTDEFGYDLTGLYFGSTTDPADSSGDLTLAYKHYAYVRRGKVFEESPKLTFTSNSRRNFKTSLSQPYELRCETVPRWYKDYLLAIYARGYVQINKGKVYRVTDIAFEGVAENDLTWKPYAKLVLEKDFQFGCEDCTPIVLPCINAMNSDDSYMSAGYLNQLFQGTMPAGGALEWQIFNDDNALVASGTITAAPWKIVTDNVDKNNLCYKLKWRVNCANGQNSPWKEQQIGNCTPPVTGCINMDFGWGQSASEILCNGATQYDTNNTARFGYYEGGQLTPAPMAITFQITFTETDPCTGVQTNETVDVTIPAGQTFVDYNYTSRTWVSCGSQCFEKQRIVTGYTLPQGTSAC